MEEQIILTLKILGFAFLTILLSSMAIHLQATNETVLFWLINSLNSIVLITVGVKAFNKK